MEIRFRLMNGVSAGLSCLEQTDDVPMFLQLRGRHVINIIGVNCYCLGYYYYDDYY